MEHLSSKESEIKVSFSWQQFVGASLKAIKPHVQPSIVMPVLVGMVVTMQRLPIGREWLVLLSVFFFYSGAISAFNDYLDKERDATNHPTRLYISGALSPMVYLLTFVGLFVMVSLIMLAFVTTISVFFQLVLIYAIIEGMHLIYCQVPDQRFRGFGRQSLLYLGSMLLVLFGGLAVGSPPPVMGFIAPAVGLFFGSGIIGKDIFDVRGDRATGLITLPISFGSRIAGWISAMGHFLAFAIILWLVFGSELSSKTIPYLVVAGLMVAFSCAHLIRGKYGRYWGIPMLVGFVSQLVFELGIIVGAITL